MGKRKKAARKPQGPKKREPLSTTFNCLFCNHEQSVTCKLDKKAGIGSLSCKICGQGYQSAINYLSHAVDVYSEWVDACDDIVNPKSKSAGGAVNRNRGDRDRDRGGDYSRPSQIQNKQQSYSPRADDDEDEVMASGGAHGDGLSDLDDDEEDDLAVLGLNRKTGGATRRAMVVDDDDDDDM